MGSRNIVPTTEPLTFASELGGITYSLNHSEVRGVDISLFLNQLDNWFQSIPQLPGFVEEELTKIKNKGAQTYVDIVNLVTQLTNAVVDSFPDSQYSLDDFGKKVDKIQTINDIALTNNIMFSSGDFKLNAVNNTADSLKPLSIPLTNAINELVESNQTINGHALSNNVNITPGNLHLDNVDNTADINKPLSANGISALSQLVENITQIGGHPLTNDVILTANDVGLNNVNNTSDADKPISLQLQQAISGYVPSTRKINNIPFLSDIQLQGSNIGLGNVSNTFDLDKPISDIQQVELLKYRSNVVVVYPQPNTTLEWNQLAIINWNGVTGTIFLPTTSSIGNFLIIKRVDASNSRVILSPLNLELNDLNDTLLFLSTGSGLSLLYDGRNGPKSIPLLTNFHWSWLVNYIKSLSMPYINELPVMGTLTTSIIGGFNGAVYCVDYNRIYFIPYNLNGSDIWMYWDCQLQIFQTFPGILLGPEAYVGGVAVQNRIFLSPFNQCSEPTWHYIECKTNTIVAYNHGATIVTQGYSRAVVSANENLIFLVPFLQTNTWHYINPTSLTAGTYTGGTEAGYKGGILDPNNNRIYFVPNTKTSIVWHFVDCNSITIGTYSGVILPPDAYVGAVYAPTLNRGYFVPYSQSNQSSWHYIDFQTGSIKSYDHQARNVVVNAYIGGAFMPNQNRIYFAPRLQSNQPLLHYIDGVTGKVMDYNNTHISVDSCAGACLSPSENRIFFVPLTTRTIYTYIGSVGGDKSNRALAASPLFNKF